MVKIKEIHALEHVKNGLTYKEIQEKYSINRGVWTYWVKKFNLKYDYRHFRCNDFYFDKIDSYNKAYILGFFYADGWLSKEGRMGFLLHHQDKEVLEFIKKELNIESEISNYNHQSIKRSPQVKLRFSSKRIFNRLLELGFSINKTKTETDLFLKIPELYKKAFIMGYLDGDGNIRCQKDVRGYYKYGLTFCNGNKNILFHVAEYIDSVCNSKYIFKTYKNKSEYYIVSWYKKTVIKSFIENFYDKTKFQLSRKRKIIEKLELMLCGNTEVTEKNKKFSVP